MKIKLPQYSGKDYMVLAFFVLPFTLAINCVIFGWYYFSSLNVFLLTTGITAIAFSIDFILCGGVAVLLKKRFPKECQVGTKLSIMISVFLLLTGLFLVTLFRGYESVPFLDYTFNRDSFTWAYVGMGIGNVFLTFLHEGISRFENWKANLKETEALKSAYRQSQLQGLKSQINPHFLFNSLNSLSSLIQEDEKKSEQFLNEMSKVYRYMLRNDDEQLVTLDTELKFLDSYFFLLKARYGDGLQVFVQVNDRTKLLPPLTLQAIIENAFSQNTIIKNQPLIITINEGINGTIEIKNNVQPKLIRDPGDMESGLDNLVNKYALLNQSGIVIEENGQERIIILPLIKQKEEEVV